MPAYSVEMILETFRRKAANVERVRRLCELGKPLVVKGVEVEVATLREALAIFDERGGLAAAPTQPVTEGNTIDAAAGQCVTDGSAVDAAAEQREEQGLQQQPHAKRQRLEVSAEATPSVGQQVPAAALSAEAAAGSALAPPERAVPPAGAAVGIAPAPPAPTPQLIDAPAPVLAAAPAALAAGELAGGAAAAGAQLAPVVSNAGARTGAPQACVSPGGPRNVLKTAARVHWEKLTAARDYLGEEGSRIASGGAPAATVKPVFLVKCDGPLRGNQDESPYQRLWLIYQLINDCLDAPPKDMQKQFNAWYNGAKREVWVRRWQASEEWIGSWDCRVQHFGQMSMSRSTRCVSNFIQQ